jgi:hypothetical protein
MLTKLIPIAVLKAFLKPICLRSTKVSNIILVIKPLIVAKTIISNVEFE